MKRVLVVTETRKYEMPMQRGDTKQSAIEWFQDTLNQRDMYLVAVANRTYEVVEQEEEVTS